MRPVVDVNPNMLIWAIDRAGLDLQELSSKDSNLKKWINGEKKPTVKQLEKFSKKVYLPFGYFFFSEPPLEKLTIPYFRSVNANNRISINVYDTILLMQKRQDWLKDYLTTNEFQILPFVGKYPINHNLIEIVTDIRTTLDLDKNWASNSKTWEEALSFLIKKIEDIGIIVVLNGFVGNNNYRKIPVDECRGFVLVDKIAPFMFINSSDSKAAQIFTVLHELAHIWTGNSAGFDFRNLQPANDPIEMLCDKVAAEFLVPTIELNKYWNNTPNIKSASIYFKVSQIVIARRALDTGKITKKEFFDFYDAYISKEKDAKSNQSYRSDFYSLKKKRLGLRFAMHIHNAVKTRQLLYRDAYELTGLKGNTFQKFFTEHI